MVRVGGWEPPVLEGAGDPAVALRLWPAGSEEQQKQQQETSRERMARVQRTNMMQLAPPWKVLPMPCGEEERPGPGTPVGVAGS